MLQHRLRKPAAGRVAAAKGKGSAHPLKGILKSFFCGAASCLALLCTAALLFEKTNLPLALVYPAACLAAAVGAFVSGLVLAWSWARYRLLAGLACGAFCCLCLLLAAVAGGSIPQADGRNLSLLIVLLLGGTAGGAAAAMFAPARAGQVH